MSNKEKLLEQIADSNIEIETLLNVGAFNQIHGIAFNGSEFDYNFLEQVAKAYKSRNITNFPELFNNYMQEFNAKEKEQAKGVSKWLDNKTYRNTKAAEKQQEEPKPKNPFYAYSEKGKPYKPLDDKIALHIIDNYHVIVIDSRPYIYTNGVYKLDAGGRFTKSLIKDTLLERDKSFNIISRIYNLLIDIPDINYSYDNVNQYPKHWINFKNGMLDTKTLELKEHDYKYLSINQIPHNYNPDAVYKDSVADVFIRDIIPDKADRDMFYTYCGYCMTRETYLQKFLVLIGSPGTGKSTLLNMVIETIGEENMQGLSISDINDGRFSKVLLVGKLINICADLPKEPLKAVDVIKKLTGEDGLQCEIKHGSSFYVKNMYVRLAFSTNEMPISLDEQSNAWYRRLLMLNIPKKGNHIENLPQGLTDSISGFIVLCVRRLNALYKTKPMTIDSPNSVKLVAEYYHDSDSVQSWLDDCCKRVQGARAETKETYQLYCKYCDENNISTISARKFHSNLKTKGFKKDRSSVTSKVTGSKSYYTYFIDLDVTKLHESNAEFTQLSNQDNPFLKELNKK